MSKMSIFERVRDNREADKKSVQMYSIHDWWKRNSNKVNWILVDLDHFATRLGRNIARMAVIGILLHIVASYFWPELPDQIPTIYGWFDGWMRFAEFAYRCALKGVFSIFTGNFPEFMNQYGSELSMMWQQFLDWLQNLWWESKGDNNPRW